MRQVVDVGQAIAHRVECVAADAWQGLEVHVVKPDVPNVAGLGAILAAPLVDEIDDRVTNALDRRNVQLAGSCCICIAPGTQRNRAFVSGFGILHAEGNGAHARTVLAGKALGERIRLGVDNEVDAPLAIQRHIFVAVLGNRCETHALKYSTHGLRVGCRVFDELKAVGAHGVVPGRMVGPQAFHFV